MLTACALVAAGQTVPATTTAATQPAGPDLSSPKATLNSVYAALKAGDVAVAKACLLYKSPAQAELFDISFTQLYAPMKLMHAMEARFGEAARRPFGNGPLEKSLDQLLEKTKNAEIDTQGDQAVVTDHRAAINPSAESELTGITFKKDGSQWKIVAGTFSEAGSTAEMPPAQLPFMRAMRDGIAAACDATSARLAAGEFKTPEEAYADYQARVQNATRAAAAAATQKGR